MTDLIDEINEANRSISANVVAIVSLLMEKGIITAEEMEIARLQAIAIVDQEFQKGVDENRKRYFEDHPNMKFLVDLLNPELP